jgi:membrane protein implicated in regulation of membrane protease activity
MRNQPPFSCPQCGDTGLGGDKCLRCKVEMLDRAGQAVLTPPALFLSLATFDGFTNPWAGWASGAAFLISLLSLTTEERPWWVILVIQVVLWGTIYGVYRALNERRVKRYRQRLQAVRDRVGAAGPVTPIAQAEGRVHIRGKVSVIKPVKGPMGDPVAAYLVRRKKDTVETIVSGRRRREAITAQTVEESSACGVFVIKDESGTALVDDDAFVLGAIEPQKSDWDDPITLIVREGSEVEILGTAKRIAASAHPEIAKSGSYRDAPSLLVFDGTPDDRVLLLAQQT